MIAVSHAENPTVLRRARDLYSVYMASCNGLNYQGLPCPQWDALTEAVRGHWYVVALRTLQLGHCDATADRGMCDERIIAPSDYVLGHLADPERALMTWTGYSEVKS